MKNYSGNPGNVSNALTSAIVQITDTTPNVVQTLSAHNFSTFDYVIVSGNFLVSSSSVFQITVIDPTHFSLNGTTTSGSGTQVGGTARDVSLTPFGSLPDDGEYATAQSIEAFLQLLADRTQWLALLGTVRSKTFTSTTSWTSPVDGFALVGGCGGGGGGGGGYGNGTANSTYGVGGGGGGGSLWSWQLVHIVKGALYDVIIGAGGTGGAGGAAGNNSGNAGNDGGDSTFVDDATSVVLARFPGAGKGWGATGGTQGSTDPGHMTWGGAAVSGAALGGSLSFPGETSDRELSAAANAAVMQQLKTPAMGGFGLTNGSGTAGVDGGRGMRNPVPYLAASNALSNGGTGGTDSTVYFGGGPGGGGGSGPGGTGGDGGNGGNGSASTGGNGTDGVAATANSGSGGGGGGAGAVGNTGGGAGGNGAAGGSGKVQLIYIGSIIQ